MHGVHEQLAGHDQRFFVRQQDFFPSARRGQRRSKAGGADDGGHHGIGVGGASDGAQRRFAVLNFGAQAAFAPRSFFDDFPLGRGWIAAEGGAYDEHLVRDVGVLFLALILVTVWAIWRRSLARPVACAWLLQGSLHLWYHIGHLDGLDGIDKFGMVMSLAAVPVLALIALWAGSSTGTRAPADRSR